MAEPPYIVVTGGIGAGKSTVTEVLARDLDLAALPERPEMNPFLRSYYADSQRWALPTELWFLLDAVQRQEQAREGGVQEHSASETVEVYGRVVAERGYITDIELELLRALLRTLTQSLRQPDLVVALDAPVEERLRRLRLRNRQYEAGVSGEYLRELDARRHALLASGAFPRLVHFDTAEADVRTSKGRDQLSSAVRTALS